MRRKHRRTPSETTVGLGLNEVLTSLSRDLVSASNATVKQGGGYGLGVERAEIELTVTVTKESSGSAQGNVTVRVLPWTSEAGLSASGVRKNEDSRLHRITLSLIPVLAELPGPPLTETSDPQEEQNRRYLPNDENPTSMAMQHAAERGTGSRGGMYLPGYGRPVADTPRIWPGYTTAPPPRYVPMAGPSGMPEGDPFPAETNSQAPHVSASGAVPQASGPDSRSDRLASPEDSGRSSSHEQSGRYRDTL